MNPTLEVLRAAREGRFSPASDSTPNKKKCQMTVRHAGGMTARRMWAPWASQQARADGPTTTPTATSLRSLRTSVPARIGRS